NGRTTDPYAPSSISTVTACSKFPIATGSTTSRARTDSSLARAHASLQQPHAQTVTDDGRADHDAVRESDVDVGDAEEAVAERVHDVEDRVRVRNSLRPTRQHVHAVEDAAEICEWRQHERRDERDLVEVLRENRVDQPEQREHER